MTSSSFCWRIARNITLVNRLTRRNGSSDIDDHRVAGPAFHELLLPKVAVKSFFHHFNTSEIHKLRIRFEPAVERHADLPGPREYLRVLDGRFVTDDVGSLWGVSLDHMQRIAVEIAGAIE